MATNQALKYFDGDGTEQNPILIKSEEDLLSMADPEIGEAGFHFKQINNIDLSSLSSWPEISFSGNYDGSFYELKLYSELPLFTNINNSNLKNLKLISGNLTNKISNSQINNCQTMDSYLVNSSVKTQLHNCEANGRIVQNNSENDDIQNCISAGGVLGVAINTKIIKCKNNGFLANSLTGCKVSDIELAVTDQIDTIYLINKSDIASTTLMNIFISLSFSSSDDVYLLSHPQESNSFCNSFIFSNEKINIQTHRNNDANFLKTLNMHKNNLVTDTISFVSQFNNFIEKSGFFSLGSAITINQLTSDGTINSAVKSLTPDTIPKKLASKRQLETRLKWDFDTVWEWDETENKPKLRNVGVAGHQAQNTTSQNAPAKDSLIHQQLTANIWLGS